TLLSPRAHLPTLLPYASTLLCTPLLFLFNDPAPPEFYTLSLHDALPISVRYGLWVAAVVHGDLGESIRINRPVLDLVLEKLPVTAELAGLAMCFALLIGIPAGVLSAVKNGSVWDYPAHVLPLLGLSTPHFPL